MWHLILKGCWIEVVTNAKKCLFDRGIQITLIQKFPHKASGFITNVTEEEEEEQEQEDKLGFYLDELWVNFWIVI